MRPESAPIAESEIQAALSTYGFLPSAEQCAKIRSYVELLLRWNQSLNLTTVTKPAEIVGRHFGESVFASKLLPVENCRLVDIGTGAGFPGLALKIADPSIDLVLIESNKKKCAFLAEVTRALDLANVEIWAERFEEIRPESIDAKVIAARAVGEFKSLLQWSRQALSRRGHVVLWLGGEDVTRISSDPTWLWQPAVKIPESQRRFILIGRPDDAMKNPR